MTCLVVDALLWLAGILVVWLLVALFRGGPGPGGTSRVRRRSSSAAARPGRWRRGLGGSTRTSRRCTGQMSTEEMADMSRTSHPSMQDFVTPN